MRSDTEKTYTLALTIVKMVVTLSIFLQHTQVHSLNSHDISNIQRTHNIHSVCTAVPVA